MNAFFARATPNLAALVLLLLLLAPAAQGKESEAVSSPRDTVSLISSQDSIGSGSSLYIGLHFKLAEGWHIYWKNPGDAGQAPELKLAPQSAVSTSSFLWPTPVRLREGPAMVFAYKDDITLPIKVEIAQSFRGDRLQLEGDASWLVCSEACVPEKGHFSLDLPIGPGTVSQDAATIDKGLRLEPVSPPFKLRVVEKPSLALEVTDLPTGAVKDAWFLPDTWGAIENAAPQTVTKTDRQLSLALKPGPLFKPGSQLSGVLVIDDASRGEAYYTVAASSETEPARSNGLPETLLFALLGGLILNLMPCVFPVLAMKALSLLHLSTKERRHVRSHAIFYTFGVLVAFASIAALLLAIRSGGARIGWGFQFQSPAFVAFIAWLLFAVGLNLSGVFAFGTRMMGIGNNFAARTGSLGSFATGILAVIVASPCVAPFLGAAIAAALSGPPLALFAIFLTMGFGLALPYTLLSLFPKAITILPKPGVWMKHFKEALAFPMFAASAWLIWVLSQQSGSRGLAEGLAGLLMIAIAAWLNGQVHPRSNSGRRVTNFLTAIVVLTACGLLANIQTTTAAATSASAPVSETFSDQRLAELEASGTPTFVDMTAAWCLTCLVNERVAIASGAVQSAFQRDHIVYLKGDWTQQDPVITRFLEQHGSDGVPLYVFFPGHRHNTIVLPQILTPAIILRAVDKPPTEGD